MTSSPRRSGGSGPAVRPARSTGSGVLEGVGVRPSGIPDHDDPRGPDLGGPVGDRDASGLRVPGSQRTPSPRNWIEASRAASGKASTREGTTRTASGSGLRGSASLGPEDLVEPLQPEGEADPPVVAIAPQDPGQAVVAPAAADLDRAPGRGGDDLEDHLRVEADPPAESEVELDPIERRRRGRPAGGPGPERRTRSGATSSKSRPRRSRISPGGPFRPASRPTWSRTRSGFRASRGPCPTSAGAAGGSRDRLAGR